MKKFISLFILMIIALTSYAQSNSVYKIYRTQNYHNQLRLNTMTGFMGIGTRRFTLLTI